MNCWLFWFGLLFCALAYYEVLQHQYPRMHQIETLTFRNYTKCVLGKDCTLVMVPEGLKCKQLISGDWTCNNNCPDANYNQVTCQPYLGSIGNHHALINTVTCTLRMYVNENEIKPPPSLAPEFWFVLGYYTTRTVTIDGVLLVNPHYIKMENECYSERFYNEAGDESLPNPHYIDFTDNMYHAQQVYCFEGDGLCCSNPYWSPYNCQSSIKTISSETLRGTIMPASNEPLYHLGLTPFQWMHKPVGSSLYTLLLKEMITVNHNRKVRKACVTEEFSKKKTAANTLIAQGHVEDSFDDTLADTYVELFKIFAAYNLGITGSGHGEKDNEQWIDDQIHAVRKEYDSTRLKIKVPDIKLTPEQKELLSKPCDFSITRAIIFSIMIYYLSSLRWILEGVLNIVFDIVYFMGLFVLGFLVKFFQ